MDYNKAAEELFVTMKNQSKSRTTELFQEFSHGEKMVLQCLSKRVGTPTLPSDIAVKTDTSTARIATILNGLESKGLVTREISRQDRRKILVALTGKGKKEIEEIQRRFVGYLSKVLEQMGSEAAQSFIEGFQCFFETAEQVLNEELEKGEQNV